MRLILLLQSRNNRGSEGGVGFTKLFGMALLLQSRERGRCWVYQTVWGRPTVTIAGPREVKGLPNRFFCVGGGGVYSLLVTAVTT